MNKVLKLIGIIIGIALALGLSWIMTCGIVKLITMCFGMEFSWAKATGIWLLLGLLSGFLKSSSNGGNN